MPSCVIVHMVSEVFFELLELKTDRWHIESYQINSIFRDLQQTGFHGKNNFMLSKLPKDSRDVQVNMLLYAMGPQSEGVFSKFSLSEDDSKKYNVVISKFDIP